MEQILAHLVGDFYLQSDWMACNKAKRTWPCLVHVVLYTLPFVLLTQSWRALLVILGTHFIIDRFGIARYLIWLKNHLAPFVEWERDPGQMDYGIWSWKRPYPKWMVCSRTGYFDERSLVNETSELCVAYVDASASTGPRPFFITVWLTIISDNTLHLLCNYAALRWLS